MCVMVDLWFAEYGTRHRLGKIGDGIRICEFITFSCENSIFCWCVCGVWVGFSNSCRGEYRAGSSAGSISACSSVWKFIFNGSAPDKGKCYEEFMWLYLPIFEFRNHESCLWTKCCLAQNFLYALFSIFLSVIISWSMYFDIYLFCIMCFMGFHLAFQFLSAEMCGTDALACRSRCCHFNFLCWVCFKGGTHRVFCKSHNMSWFDFIRIVNGFLQLLFPYGWSWNTSLLLGGLLSATDPVAVVALLKDLGASKKLSTIIEGESLMNDGYNSADFSYNFFCYLPKYCSLS